MRKYLNSIIRANIALALLFAFLFNCVGPLPAFAQDFYLPTPGQMVALSPSFSPAILKGIQLDAKNPFKFHFFVDRGDGSLSQAELKQESSKFIKYFLASLTIPESDLWVNLSPYEKNRIVPQEFGQTQMGRDLLAEDYMLKQITASLIYPEDKIGREFWAKVYAEAQKKYGTTNIPINTFNKVWIIPDKAVVYENNGTAFVLESHLKVMLEQDYLSLQKHSAISPSLIKEGVRGSSDINAIGSQIVRELVIPQLEHEVNYGKNFSQLRQVFYSLILAAWYKNKIKSSIFNKIYSDRNKINGVTPSTSIFPVSSKSKGSASLRGQSPKQSNTTDVEYIYQQYLKAFKKGVFNYIQEEPDPLTSQTIPRKYFSGGVDWDRYLDAATTYENQITPAQLAGINPAQLTNELVTIAPAMHSSYAEMLGPNLKPLRLAVLLKNDGLTLEQLESLIKNPEEDNEVSRKIDECMAKLDLNRKTMGKEYFLKIFGATIANFMAESSISPNAAKSARLLLNEAMKGAEHWQDQWARVPESLRDANGWYLEHPYPASALQFVKDKVTRASSGKSTIQLVDLGAGANLYIPKQISESLSASGITAKIHALDSADVKDVLRLSTSTNILYHQGDMESPNDIAPVSMDIIISTFALEYTDMAKSLEQIKRMLAPKGRVILVLHHPDSLATHSIKFCLSKTIEVNRQLHQILKLLENDADFHEQFLQISRIAKNDLTDEPYLNTFIKSCETYLGMNENDKDRNRERLIDETKNVIQLAEGEINTDNRVLKNIFSSTSAIENFFHGQGLKGRAIELMGHETLGNQLQNRPQGYGVVLSLDESANAAMKTQRSKPIEKFSWDWDKVQINHVDSYFDQWVTSKGIAPADLRFLKQILLGDPQILSQLLKQYPSKIWIKDEDRKKPEFDGRTVYLKLIKPFPSIFGNITILRIKGARPRISEGSNIIEAHKGTGFVLSPTSVDDEGDLFKAEIDPDHTSPQGALFEFTAEKEYDVMRGGFSNKGFDTDYPIAFGQWKNLLHLKAPVGFVIAGMFGEDVRININGVVDPNKILIDIGNGHFLATDMQISKDIYWMMGKDLRAFHDNGYFHQYPYSANWGVEIGKGAAVRVILRDLDTTLTRRNIPKQNRDKIEVSYRLVDIERIISSLTGQGRGGAAFLNPNFMQKIYRPLIESFLKGYFHDQDFNTENFRALVDEDSNVMFPRLGRRLLRSDEKLSLNEFTHNYGKTWKNLYTIVNKAMNASNNSVDSQINSWGRRTAKEKNVTDPLRYVKTFTYLMKYVRSNPKISPLKVLFLGPGSEASDGMGTIFKEHPAISYQTIELIAALMHSTKAPIDLVLVDQLPEVLKAASNPERYKLDYHDISHMDQVKLPYVMNLLKAFVPLLTDRDTHEKPTSAKDLYNSQGKRERQFDVDTQAIRSRVTIEKILGKFEKINYAAYPLERNNIIVALSSLDYGVKAVKSFPARLDLLFRILKTTQGSGQGVLIVDIRILKVIFKDSEYEEGPFNSQFEFMLKYFAKRGLLIKIDRIGLESLALINETVKKGNGVRLSKSLVTAAMTASENKDTAMLVKLNAMVKDMQYVLGLMQDEQFASIKQDMEIQNLDLMEVVRHLNNAKMYAAKPDRRMHAELSKAFMILVSCQRIIRAQRDHHEDYQDVRLGKKTQVINRNSKILQGLKDMLMDILHEINPPQAEALKYLSLFNQEIESLRMPLNIKRFLKRQFDLDDGGYVAGDQDLLDSSHLEPFIVDPDRDPISTRLLTNFYPPIDLIGSDTIRRDNLRKYVEIYADIQRLGWRIEELGEMQNKSDNFSKALEVLNHWSGTQRLQIARYSILENSLIRVSFRRKLLKHHDLGFDFSNGDKFEGQIKGFLKEVSDSLFSMKWGGMANQISNEKRNEIRDALEKLKEEAELIREADDRYYDDHDDFGESSMLRVNLTKLQILSLNYERAVNQAVYDLGSVNFAMHSQNAEAAMKINTDDAIERLAPDMGRGLTRNIKELILTDKGKTSQQYKVIIKDLLDYVAGGLLYYHLAYLGPQKINKIIRTLEKYRLYEPKPFDQDSPMGALESDLGRPLINRIAATILLRKNIIESFYYFNDEVYNRNLKLGSLKISDVVEWVKKGPYYNQVQGLGPAKKQQVVDVLEEYHLLDREMKGGIDLNPAQMSMQVKKSGDDFQFQWNGQTFDAAQITGATFTIESMGPVTNLPQILGLNPENNPSN